LINTLHLVKEREGKKKYQKELLAARRLRCRSTELLTAVGFGWLWVRSRPSVQTSATVVLDLRERSLARGENPTDAKEVALEIPRTARHLIMDLPIGSKEGSYELALLNEAGDEVLRATGTATLENQIVILRADIDIGNVSAGLYFLGVRQPGLEWSRYPTRVT
jgi:hypothetical protein